MPSFKKLSVNIVTHSGALSALHQEIDVTRPLCESYILSKTDCSFWISIMPDSEFFPPRIPDTPKPHRSKPSRWGRYGTPIDSRYNNKKSREYLGNQAKEPEWHLLAEVFLDSNPVAEATTIVYLPWNGRAEERILGGRLGLTKDGRTVERQWFFKDVGLENFLGTLSVTEKDKDGESGIPSAGRSAEEPDLEDMLVENMKKLGNKGKTKEDETTGIGQIKLVLRKVVLAERINPGWVPSLADNDESAKASGSAGDASHIVGFGRPDPITFSRKQKIYSSYPPGNYEPYATFIFHYRGEKQMRKLGFLDAPESHHKKLDKLIPFLNPLTISGPQNFSKSLEKSHFGPLPSTSGEESGHDLVSEELTSKNVKSEKAQSVAGASPSSQSSDGSPESSGSPDSETVHTPPSPTESGSPPGLTDVEPEPDVGLVTLAASKITISSPEDSPKDSPPQEENKHSLCRIKPIDTSEPEDGYEGDTETPKRSKERAKMSAEEEEEEVENLSQKLISFHLKRSREGGDDEDDKPAKEEEQEPPSPRLNKRIRRHKDAIGSVEAGEECMSEVKIDETSSCDKKND